MRGMSPKQQQHQLSRGGAGGSGEDLLISRALPATSHFPVQWSLDSSSGLMVLSSSLRAKQSQRVLDQIQQEEDQCSWRAKSRMKTFGIVCVLCLNLGTEPPDVIRIPPHAVTECGVDPTRYLPDHLPGVLTKIVHQLELQYRESHGAKLRLKMCPDPTSDEVRRSLMMVRKSAQGGRVVLHFNGHGVPSPTQNGEVWVYNDEFSQYIPVSHTDLIKWAGSPSVFIFDSNHAGVLLPFFQRHFAELDRKLQQQQQEQEGEEGGGKTSGNTTNNFLVLCACSADETLPSAPTLPADLFTACLTLPVPTALKWFIAQHPQQMQALGIEQRMVDFLPPGDSRRSLKGELGWIFSTLMDTIAWSVFPPALFQRLFREDVTMSNLFHNYLLAERIFRACGRRPCTLPALPETCKHKMWESWDYTVERSLMQLPGLIPPETLQQEGFNKALAVLASQRIHRAPRTTYVESRFFHDQLLAFENWLTVFPISSSTPLPPIQLPVVLQLVLSKQHRFQALALLAQFLDQSPQAISQALAVGIFPYILTSLKNITQAAAATTTNAATPAAISVEEDSMDGLRTNLLRIFVRIITFQPLLTRELVDYSAFFVGELRAQDEFSMPALACFVLAMICKLPQQQDSRRVKTALLAQDMDRIAAQHIQQQQQQQRGRNEDDLALPRKRSYEEFTSEEEEAGESGEEEEEDDVFTLGGGSTNASPMHAKSRSAAASASVTTPVDSTLIVWSCLLLASFWQGGFELATRRAHSFHIVPNLERLLCTHADATVREAAAHALGMLFGDSAQQQQPQQQEEAEVAEEDSTRALECNLVLRLLTAAKNDASPLVRREILFAASRFVLDARHVDAFRFTIYVLSDFMGEAGASPSYSELIDRLNVLIGGTGVGQKNGQKYMAIWMDLSLVFTVDPFPALSQTAQILVGCVKYAADVKWAQVTGSPQPAPPSNTLLTSDLFERAQYMLARPLKEVEEERFRKQMQAWETRKKNQDAIKAEQSWGRETYWFVSAAEELACCDWYSEEDRDAFALEEEATSSSAKQYRLVKEPFFRLFRQPSNLEGGMGAGSTPPSPRVPMGASSRQQLQQPDTVRRFDELPADVFRSTSSTKLRRSTTNLPGLLARQTSGASSFSIKSSPGLHPLQAVGRQTSFSANATGGSRLQLSRSSPGLQPLQQQLVRQTSNSSSTGFFTTKSASSSPSTNKHFIELDRIEFLPASSSHEHFTSSFHPFTPHFLLANETTISVFEAENFRQPVSVFSNLNLLSQINALTWIDSKSANPLLLVSTDDGQCRVWRDVTMPTPKLASAFSPTAGKQNNFQVDWLPTSSHLLCASANALKAWDLVSELPVWDCTAECNVTAIAASEHASVFVAGFADGTVRMFDLREGGGGVFGLAAAGSPSSTQQHPSYSAVASVSKLSKNMCFATASAVSVGHGTEIRVWEARKDVLKPMLRFDLGEMTTKVCFHENAPMFAFAPSSPAGSKAAAAAAPVVVRTMSFDNVELSLPIQCGAAAASAAAAMAGGGKRAGSGSNSSFMASKQPTPPLLQLQQPSSASLLLPTPPPQPSLPPFHHQSSIVALGWHPREIALAAVSQEAASVYVCANTSVRGVWTPANFEPELYRI